MKRIWLAVVASLAAASGCAYESSYERSVATPADEMGAPPVSSYSLPAKNPRGTVHVVSMGVERLPVAAGQPDSYLHLRIAAENHSDDTPWLLDPNDQALTFPGGTVPASFAEASTGGPIPVASVAKGGQGYLDLFYPAPPANAPQRVTLSWKVRRGNEALPGTTAFDRVVSPDASYAYYRPAYYYPHAYVGLGLGWWWWPDYYWWWGGPYAYWWGYPHFYGYYSWYYPRYYGGYRGYYGGYRGGYYGGGGYGGGGGSTGKSGWRGGGGGGGGATHAAPSGGSWGGGHSGGKSGWRGGR